MMILQQIRSLAMLRDEVQANAGGEQLITERQNIAIQILIKRFAHDRGDKIELLREIFKRHITSTLDLTFGEASALLEMGYEPIGEQFKDKVVSLDFYMTMNELMEAIDERKRSIPRVYIPHELRRLRGT